MKQAIREAIIKLEMAEKYDLDIGWHQGYLQGLKDVNEGNLRFLSKLDSVMNDKCVKDVDVAKIVGDTRQSIYDKRVKGMKSRTVKAKKIAKFLGVEPEDILEV